MPDYKRLSDEILKALDMALDQGDLDISETLNIALEKSLTRKSGGGEFIECREYPEEIMKALDRLDKLRSGT